METANGKSIGDQKYVHIRSDVRNIPLEHPKDELVMVFSLAEKAMNVTKGSDSLAHYYLSQLHFDQCQLNMPDVWP